MAYSAKPMTWVPLIVVPRGEGHKGGGELEAENPLVLQRPVLPTIHKNIIISIWMLS